MSSSSRLAILASLLVGAVPEVAAAQEVVAETPFREVGTFEAEVRCFSIDAAGETAYVVDTGGQAYAWDLSGDEERWRARIGSGFSANAIDVGEEYVAYVIGIPGASILDAATGADGPRVGIADPRLSSFAVACDPKDRWV